MARDLLEEGKDKIVLPVDFLTVRQINAPETETSVEGGIPDSGEGVDIGSRSIAQFKQKIAKAQAVVRDEPLGKFEDEPSSKGTRAIAETLANAKAITIVVVETAKAVEGFGRLERKPSAAAALRGTAKAAGRGVAVDVSGTQPRGQHARSLLPQLCRQRVAAHPRQGEGRPTGGGRAAVRGASRGTGQAALRTAGL